MAWCLTQMQSVLWLYLYIFTVYINFCSISLLIKDQNCSFLTSQGTGINYINFFFLRLFIFSFFFLCPLAQTPVMMLLMSIWHALHKPQPEFTPYGPPAITCRGRFPFHQNHILLWHKWMYFLFFFFLNLALILLQHSCTPLDEMALSSHTRSTILNLLNYFLLLRWI